MRRLFALVLLTNAASAADKPDNLDFFEKKIRPVLSSRCYPCHTGKSAAAGLHLDSADGTRGAITAGDPDSSRLIHAVRRDGDLKMPPSGPLPAEEIADFEAWVKMGAPDPRTGGAVSPYDFEEAKKFWSFQAVKDPEVPRVADRAWSKTAIDRFVKAKLEEKKLTAVGLASKRALIRRATFDLTGLPPTPEEVDAFAEDKSPEAFDKLIDRLLATQQYGERWGRHWLDLVRYADTCGDNADFPVPDAWRYRNWVIRAFNEDKPYDQFVREQIAGDLIGGDRTATGYLAMARRFGSGGNEFHLTIDDAIDNLGKTMLGLSVACARCHDHKFDPVPSRDYYALYGILQSTKFPFPGTELYPHARDFVAIDPKNAKKLKDYQDETSDLDHRLRDLMDGKEGKDLRKEDREKEIWRLKDRMAVLEHDAPKVERLYAVSEGTPADAKIQIKGEPKKTGDVVPRGFLTVLGGERLPAEEKGSGRRELAEWIAGSPMFARVMVNRIWQFHFGKGIVGTPNDFGARGDAPVNPELLDWLASRFRESGYSVKAMHRLIMKTRAYQLASDDDVADAKIDPKNEYQWRFDRRRLDAEEIRDAMLAAAGDLDREMGGPHPFPPEVTFKYTQHVQFFAVYETRKRSVYLMQQRLKKHPMLEVFDGADPNASTPRRGTEETSIQALTMMNGKFVEEQADLLAVRVGMAYPGDADRIRYAYRLVYGRAATPAEIGECLKYLAQATAALRKSNVEAERQPRAALASLMHVLLASDEFVFVD